MRRVDSRHYVPSRSPVLRKKGTALILSFIAPGLGEFYATAYSRGAAIFLARFLIFLLTAYVIVQSPAAIPFGYALMTFAIPSLTLISMKNAWSLAGNSLVLGRLNSLPVYLAFILCSLCVTLSGAALVTSLVMPVIVQSDTSLPLIKRNEVILVSPSKPGKPDRGSLVMFTDGSILRIVGLPGEKVTFSGDQILVDRYPLAHEIMDRTRFGWRFPEFTREIVLEENHGKRYPVLPDRGPEKTVAVPENRILAIPDDRRGGYATEPRGFLDLRGVVRGVLFSRDWYRLFLLPEIR